MNKFLRMKGRVMVYCLGRGVGGEGRTILGDHMVFQGERRWDQSSPTGGDLQKIYCQQVRIIRIIITEPYEEEIR